jgi:hypothetical protein
LLHLKHLIMYNKNNRYNIQVCILVTCIASPHTFNSHLPAYTSTLLSLSHNSRIRGTKQIKKYIQRYGGIKQDKVSYDMMAIAPMYIQECIYIPCDTLKACALPPQELTERNILTVVVGSKLNWSFLPVSVCVNKIYTLSKIIKYYNNKRYLNLYLHRPYWFALGSAKAKLCARKFEHVSLKALSELARQMCICYALHMHVYIFSIYVITFLLWKELKPSHPFTLKSNF